MAKEFLTAKQVSEILQISEYNVRKLANEKKIKSIMIGGSIRFSRSYIDSLEIEAGAVKNDLSKKQLELELEEYKQKYQKLKNVLAIILAESSKSINL